MENLRNISAARITETVKELCIRANCFLNEDISCALLKAGEEEDYPPAREILNILQKNAEVAKSQSMAICQDTGMAVVFLSIGQDVHITDGSLEEAVNAGVRKGYEEGYLRKSVVYDPLRRKNTGDNTPAVIHTRIVPGNELKIEVAPKGFGSENMSRIAMLNPSDGLEGVKRFVLETVRLAGPNPCPPMILGIGIGGTFEKVAQLAKEALLVPLDEEHSDPFYAALEKELLALINETGIGPQGFGGKTTCLGVKIRAYPTHIAGLPVAVNVGCHVTRHAQAVL
jgi:fumarate hydratase subunit alpha